MKKVYLVVREACLMEDEGHSDFVMAYRTQKAADKWVAKQAGEYFGPGDYYVVAVSFTDT